MASARAQRQSGDLRYACAQILRRPHPDADQFLAVLDRAGESAAQHRFELARDRVRIESLECRTGAVDMDINRVAGDFDAIEHFHHAGDFSHRGGDFPGPDTIGRLVAEYLHLDRLRCCDQIADQVFHQLRGLDAQTRHLRGDLVAHIAHDFLDAAARRWLEVDHEVALVGFGQTAAELQTGAARIAVDFRRGGHDCLDLAQQAIGFRQRRAGCTAIVEREATFVHLRHKARTESRIGK